MKINPTAQNLPHPVISYADTWMSLDALGQERPYHPTYESFGVAIDDFHAYLANCPLDGIVIKLGLAGWLQRADALKLYELGYFANGDILEFGTYCGLSTFILAKAIQSSGRRAHIVTMELDPRVTMLAKRNLASRSVDSFVDFREGDANATCSKLIAEGRKFSFAFIDHSHAYEPMVLACERLAQLLTVGSFCLFHDFNDPRNTATPGVGESENQYGVYAAVQSALDRKQFEFYGIFGCCGLYRKVA